MDEIINKVEESGLMQFDLEELYQPGERVIFDLKEWLFEELILKEKDFRERLKTTDWAAYQNTFIALTCTADAIVPTWAYMLIVTHLGPFAKKIVFGDLAQLNATLFRDAIAMLDPSKFIGQKIVIKGCGDKVPASAYVEFTAFLRPIAKSIMYGEPCSTVPVFKSKN